MNDTPKDRAGPSRGAVPTGDHQSEMEKVADSTFLAEQKATSIYLEASCPRCLTGAWV